MFIQFDNRNYEHRFFSEPSALGYAHNHERKNSTIFVEQWAANNVILCFRKL